MAYTADQQKIFDWIRNALPDWAFSVDGMDEFIGALVVTIDTVRIQRQEWRSQTLIGTSDGDGPDWTNEHAKDRDTRRQVDEDDPTLKDRLRNIPDAVTRPTILAAVNAVLVGAGVSGEAAMYEARRDRIYLSKLTARTGTGGTFATVSGDVRKFTPTVAFPLPVEVGHARSGAQGNPRIVFSGCDSAGNDGTFEVTDLDGNAVVFTNASGVAEADAGVSWSLRRYDVEGNNREGRCTAYLGRGYRWGHRMNVIILPYGTSAGTAAGIADLVRQIRAAGFPFAVETRTTPP